MRGNAVNKAIGSGEVPTDAIAELLLAAAAACPWQMYATSRRSCRVPMAGAGNSCPTAPKAKYLECSLSVLAGKACAKYNGDERYYRVLCFQEATVDAAVLDATRQALHAAGAEAVGTAIVLALAPSSGPAFSWKDVLRVSLFGVSQRLQQSNTTVSWHLLGM